MRLAEAIAEIAPDLAARRQNGREAHGLPASADTKPAVTPDRLRALARAMHETQEDASGDPRGVEARIRDMTPEVSSAAHRVSGLDGIGRLEPREMEYRLLVWSAHGGAGASTLTLAVSEAAEARWDGVRAVDAASPRWSGLVGLADVELDSQAGWIRGRHRHLTVDRLAIEPRGASAVPALRDWAEEARSSTGRSALTVIDVGWTPREVVRCSGWLETAMSPRGSTCRNALSRDGAAAHIPASDAHPQRGDRGGDAGRLPWRPLAHVVVAHSTSNGLRQLESTLRLLSGPVVAAVVGWPRRRPPVSGLGPLTVDLWRDGAVCPFPALRHGSVVDEAPRPRSLARSAERLLDLIVERLSADGRRT